MRVGNENMPLRVLERTCTFGTRSAPSRTCSRSIRYESKGDDVIQDLVFRAFQVALRLPDNFVLKDEHKFMDVPGWDSIGHMNLVAELEERLGVSFDLDEIVAMNSVKAIIFLVSGKQKKNEGRRADLN
jgi:acyl carrier protein